MGSNYSTVKVPDGMGTVDSVEDGLIYYYPMKTFYVDGIKYDPETTYEVDSHLTRPMFSLEYDGDCMASLARFVADHSNMRITKSGIPEWSDLEWDPTIRL